MGDVWKYDQQLQVYFHAPSSTYAVPTPSGEWKYVPASEFTIGESSTGPTNAHAEKEDGEIEDDVGWGALMEPDQLKSALQPQPQPQYSGIQGEPEVETPKHILRLVVLESTVLKIGQVAIIDAREGGVQLGRDRCERGGTARVRLKEMEVSKTHALVYWGDGGEWDEGWFAVDLGSTHGTFIDDKRLSEPKHSSKPGKLTHLCKLRIASTIFSVHIHPSWPCEECQLGKENEIRLDNGIAPSVAVEPVQVAMNSKQKRENREVKRKLEMAALKQSLLSNHTTGSKEATPERSERVYVDRSAMRRALHPRSPRRRSASPGATPTAVQDVPPASTSTSTFASNMLAAQGWTPGTGLGKDRSGRAAPIEVEMRTERTGLGIKGYKQEEGDWRQRGKQRRYEDYAK